MVAPAQITFLQRPQPSCPSRVRLLYIINVGIHVPANGRCRTNVDLMLAHYRRCWPNIKTTLVYRCVFAGVAVTADHM